MSNQTNKKKSNLGRHSSRLKNYKSLTRLEKYEYFYDDSSSDEEDTFQLESNSDFIQVEARANKLLQSEFKGGIDSCLMEIRDLIQVEDDGVRLSSRTSVGHNERLAVNLEVGDNAGDRNE